MSNSTATYDPLVQSQSGKEITANAYFDAASPAISFGRRASTSSGLTWGYYGGTIQVDGSLIQIANGTLTLTASTINYVEVSRTGGVSTNITGFTAGSTPLYKAVTGTTTVTSYTDYRLQALPVAGRLVRGMSDSDTAINEAEARNTILEFTGTLTANRAIGMPMIVQQWTVFNNTSGGFGLQFSAGAGSVVTVAAGKRAIIYADGNLVVRVTADC